MNKKQIISPANTKVAVLGSGPSGGGDGGAERHFQGLVSGFKALGCSTDFIYIDADEPNFDSILDNYQRVKKLDLSSFDFVVTTKAPTFFINHPRHIVHLIHTIRVFDDMFDENFKNPDDNHFRQRALIHKMDIDGLSKAKKIFANGYEVSERLYRWRGLRSQVIHPPIFIDGLRNDLQGDYFFMPGRLHSWKRVNLAIDAILRSEQPLKLVIAGTGPDEDALRLRANNDPRIIFLGRVSDEALVHYYANALAVPFLPVREDFGYVTVEAFASSKPVITCIDSGEPTRLVKHKENGLICEPNAESIKKAFEWIFKNKDKALAMGVQGGKTIEKMSWKNVAEKMFNAAFQDDENNGAEEKLKVTVLDMQPIDPPVGGGRLRLLGLYHDLGANIDCTYVGSYDWPGEKYRKLRHTPTLEEVTIPLSDAHHNAAKELSKKANGKGVIDISFGKLGFLSPDYIEAAKHEIKNSEVIVFSHPWVFPLVEEFISPNQTVIYDSHNVEGFLRAQLLDVNNPIEENLLRDIIDVEMRLCYRSDLVLACSQEDLEKFNRLYKISAEKLRVVPNGVMAFDHNPPSFKDRSLAKERLKIQHWSMVAFFIGSPYGPNIEAADFIVNHLSPLMDDVLFVIGGGVGKEVNNDKKNVYITGFLTDEERKNWLAASDIAINPMFSGSGTNIKMFDFMAMGLPVVTTEIGARGINFFGDVVQAVYITDSKPDAFKEAINKCRDKNNRVRVGEYARKFIEDGFSWERISRICGAMLKNIKNYKNSSNPLFSIVIPSYERPEQLSVLMERISLQIDRDFEVIINDQSEKPWPARNKSWGFPLTYYHNPVKGAVRARNIGAALAQGEIIAFTDDDCLPEVDWLLNARKLFQQKDIVGIEGKIYSDHLDDPNWRPVTNVGFEGIGFMTANLMVRSECFQILGGFDLCFDHPHFREDTDFGWRLQNIGDVPYSHSVSVFHPAQPRSIERESSESRVKFFKKDALLYKKHPERYKKLFFAESHYKNTKGFISNLKIGFNDCEIPIPDWILDISEVS